MAFDLVDFLAGSSRPIIIALRSLYFHLLFKVLSLWLEKVETSLGAQISEQALIDLFCVESFVVVILTLLNFL